MKYTPTPRLKEFVNRYGTRRLASELDVSPQSVSNWCTGRQRVAANLCIRLEALSGIPREVLRPDVFKEDPCLKNDWLR